MHTRGLVFFISVGEGRRTGFGVFWNLVIYFVPNMVPNFPISSHCVFNSITFLSHILCLKFYSYNLLYNYNSVSVRPTTIPRFN